MILDFLTELKEVVNFVIADAESPKTYFLWRVQ